MAFFIDQTAHTIELNESPKRIISLVPSQTEYLFYLGLGHQIVGATWFCIHPKMELKSIKKVGGTKKLDFEIIRSLQPDLIIANKEENTKSEIEKLRCEYPVWTSDIENIDQALSMLTSLGLLLERQKESQSLVQAINEQFAFVGKKAKGSVLYLIWNKPWMAVGPDTFIHSILLHLGFNNVLTETRYPELNLNQICELNPDFVFYSSEPFPFKLNHMHELQKELPNAKHELVNGEMFSWYGNRMLAATKYFQELMEKLEVER